jgi:Bacterial Ig-like domain (group 3)
MDGAQEPEPLPHVRTPGRRWIVWIVAPAVLGVVAGVSVAAVPWARNVLALAMAISGLAWVLRVASDWFAEHAGPRRGVAMLASILLGAWLVLAVSAPGPLRSLGFGPILVPPPERDPYELPPAGSRRPLESLQQPAEPIDLKSLVTSSSSSQAAAPEPPETEAPPVASDGQRTATTATLQLSSASSVAGEGIVLMATVKGDGRPLRGIVEFEVGDAVVARQPLRVQGEISRTEHRLVGLPPGLHTIRASYLGSRAFGPSRSTSVQHRVVPR